MLTRKPTWATKELHDFLMERSDVPFAWGKNDCCLFPADAVLAMTGVDIAGDFRGRYSTQTGALRQIRKLAGGSRVGDAVAWCAGKHGLEELAVPLCAQRGDLVVLENGDGREMAGIVGLTGRHIVTVGQVGYKLNSLGGAIRVPVAEGLVTFSIERVKRAWRV